MTDPVTNTLAPHGSLWPNPQTEAWITRAIAFAAAAITAVMHLPLQVFPIARDQGNWLTAAMAMRHGKVFFRDYLHFNLPGTAFAYRAAWAVVSDPRHVAPLLAGVTAVMIVLALYLLLSETVSRWAGAWAALFFGSLFPMKISWWNIAQKDILATPWLLLTTWLVARAADGRRWRRWSLVGAGACVSWASQFKPTYVLLAVLLAIGLGLRRLPDWRATWKRLPADLAWYTAGGLLGFVPLLLYLAVHNAWSDAWFCTRVLGSGYYSGHNLRWATIFKVWWNAQKPGFARGFNFSILWWLVCFAGIPVWIACWRGRSQRWWVAPFALVAATSMLVQRKGMGYHIDPWYVGFCLFGGISAATVWRWSRLVPWRRRSWLVLALGLLLAFGLVHSFQLSMTKTHYAKAEWPVWRGQMARAQYLKKQFKQNGDHAAPPVSEAVAAWLRRETTPQDTILVWGLECQIYALADRMYATQAPFDQMLSALAPGKEVERLREEKRRFVRRLAADAPKFVLITTRDSNKVETLPSDQVIWRIPGFQEELDTHYVRREDFDRFIVYQRRP